VTTLLKWLVKETRAILGKTWIKIGQLSALLNSMSLHIAHNELYITSLYNSGEDNHTVCIPRHPLCKFLMSWHLTNLKMATVHSTAVSHYVLDCGKPKRNIPILQIRHTHTYTWSCTPCPKVWQGLHGLIKVEPGSGSECQKILIVILIYSGSPCQMCYLLYSSKFY